MNTPAHVIFSLSLLGKNNAANYTGAIALGALLPDAVMLIFYAYEKFNGVPENIIWSDHYYQPFWQNLIDIFNSVPLLLAGLALMYFKKYNYFVLLFASMLIHCFFDFPVHHDDGHRHFFPISQFRFQSPVSYWDPEHFGNITGLVEIVLFLAGSIFLWQLEKTNTKDVLQLTRLRSVVLLTVMVYICFFIFVYQTWA